jgi:hypothetical protein
MNAILLTVLALNGADATTVYGGPSGGQSGAVAGGGYCDECDACNNGGGRHGRHNNGLSGWCGPMPQSCYNPSFGCYPSTRFMHRYPAFHNTYYRAAYNYRQYFDYPWHAGLHEPTSMFSYHVPAENPGQNIPTPPPAARAATPGTVQR